ncbi:unnamed protein product [Ambrosiozyma monospora]|uniref:Unnamed protein product n=1 Tax=Ambrosiozyma monospora TaxID=43982 RepID=A0ACB5TFL0_AMBMO|nr:unnamed protein product [Ambrosiozyma monospora]
MTMAGESTRVLSNLTADYGKVLSGLHDDKIEGKARLINGIQVACLALKNRQNKTQKQRVIVFIGSPIEESDHDLEKLAKRLKKNNISIDFINFGEDQINSSKLEKFISIVNNNETSHLVSVPPGPHLLYEQVERSTLFQEEGATEMGGTGGGAGGDDFAFDDPNMDPELAMAIRLSLEEERARQERQNQQQQPQQNLETVHEDDKKDSEGDTKMDESK